MDFIEDILEFFKNDKADFSYRIIDGVGGYFLNVKEIVAFDDKNIVLAFKSCRLEISGSGLSVAKYEDRDVAVNGKITGVNRVSK
ncbi:MAG: YabP/YqfC family sporulation protein [Christensenellaceae bacterium]